MLEKAAESPSTSLIFKPSRRWSRRGRLTATPHWAELSTSPLPRLLPKAPKMCIILYRKQRQMCIQDMCFNAGRHAGRICSVEGAKDCASFNAGHARRYRCVMNLLAIAVTNDLHSQTYPPVTQVSSASESDGTCLPSIPRGTNKTKKVT